MQVEPIPPMSVAGATDEEMCRLWLSAVHASVRCLGGAVAKSARPPGPGWNYYQVLVQDHAGRSVRVLFNAAAGVVAASSDDRVASIGPLDFCDVPGADSYRQAGLTVAEPDLLGTPLLPRHMEDLTEEQRSDLKYHGAESIGDLLFNWFD